MTAEHTGSSERITPGFWWRLLAAIPVMCFTCYGFAALSHGDPYQYLILSILGAAGCMIGMVTW